MKMSTVYKITDKNSRTRPGMSNETQWGASVTHTAPGGGEMCSANWLHAYAHPMLAVLLNPAHGSFDAATMKLWKCRAIVGIRKANKLGCTELTTVEEIEIPVFTTNQKVAFALLVAKSVYKDKGFRTFATKWLTGKDRSESAAWSAAWSAESAESAAESAAWSAESAAWSAESAESASAARSAAWSAASAASAAEKLTDKKLIAFARKALSY
jgi:hypothetical protein